MRLFAFKKRVKTRILLMTIFLSFQGLDTSEPSPPIQPPVNNNNTKPPAFSTNNNPEPVKDPDSTALQIIENRKAPEGKDNDSMLENHVMDTKENSYTTDVNGKVTVHVVVTINGNGTLADLKKQRMQIRNNSSDVNSITSPMGSITDETSPSPMTDIVRFTGETAEENVGYAKSKRCCVIQ